MYRKRQILSLAELLCEAAGHVNPAKEKSMGDTRAQVAIRQEQFEASLNNYLIKKGASSKFANRQDKFKQRVASVAQELLDVAIQAKWRIEEEDKLPQCPPNVAGYVSVQLVHDYYAKSGDSDHFKFVEALRAELSPQLNSDVTVSVEPEQFHQATAAITKAAPAAGGVVDARIHTTKYQRKRVLHAVIAEATIVAVDPDDWTSVWAALVVMAEGTPKPPPLLGHEPGEGIRYLTDNEDGPVRWLKRATFGRNMRRAQKSLVRPIEDDSGQ
jgi:hypothetical protein